MTNYLKNFVTGYGINFEVSKRNVEAFGKAAIKWNEIWLQLNIDQNSVVMLCGAKSNGKSSLVRYLVNKYNHGESTGQKDSNQSEDIEDMDASSEPGDMDSLNSRYAYYIDCDPGQSEMTTPGIISAHIIRASAPPLQSPTYLNTSRHESIVQASVGGTNMSVNPRMFIENSRYLANQVKEHQSNQTTKQPIFINTMGHIRNVGLAMLMDLVKIFKPTNLVVLNVSNDPMRTIYADLSPQIIESTKASFYYETSKQSKGLKYQYDVHNLEFSLSESTSIATRNRTALQLAYIASMPEALYKPIMQISPRWISLKTTSIHCVSSYPLKEGIIFELLYHSWVHLVHITRQQNLIHENSNDDCITVDEVGKNLLLGCGIIADIDLENKRLAVITPLDQETIDNHVNCVIKPLSIQVPREMLPTNL